MPPTTQQSLPTLEWKPDEPALLTQLTEASCAIHATLLFDDLPNVIVRQAGLAVGAEAALLVYAKLEGQHAAGAYLRGPFAAWREHTCLLQPPMAQALFSAEVRTLRLAGKECARHPLWQQLPPPPEAAQPHSWLSSALAE